MSTPASQTPARPARATGRMWLTIALLVGGAALLYWQIEQLDLSVEDLREGFAAIGYWFAAILVLSLVRFIVRSKAWIALLDKSVPLRAALAATLAGDALGNVTPLGLVASEPTKAIYLRAHVGPTIGLAALTAENVFYTVSVALYVIISATAMLTAFTLPASVAFAGIASLLSMAAALVAIAWLSWARPTVMSAIAERVPFARLRKLAGWIRIFETHTYGAVGSRSQILVRVVALEASFHVLSLIECWLAFWLLTGETSLLPALVFDGVNRVVNVLFKQVPLRLGVEEVTTATVAAAIGLAAHDGFVLALVRKVRVIVWAVVGLLLLWKRTLASQSTPPNP